MLPNIRTTRHHSQHVQISRNILRSMKLLGVCSVLKQKRLILGGQLRLLIRLLERPMTVGQHIP